MKRKKFKILIGLAVLFLFGALGLGLVGYRATRYETVRPTRGDITEAVYALGRVESHRKFNVILGILSSVARTPVREGDTVEKGALLMEFDSGLRFRAPFRGTVTYVGPEEGETVLPNTPALTLMDLKNRYIELSLEQEAALRVRKGQKARVSLESLRGTVLEGEVTALFPREDEFLAHVEVPALQESVLPGMTADVSVEIGTIENAVLVPVRAISNGMVTVKRNGKWEKVKVDVGHVDGTNAEIRGGKIGMDDEIRVRKE